MRPLSLFCGGGTTGVWGDAFSIVVCGCRIIGVYTCEPEEMHPR